MYSNQGQSGLSLILILSFNYLLWYMYIYKYLMLDEEPAKNHDKQRILKVKIIISYTIVVRIKVFTVTTKALPKIFKFWNRNTVKLGYNELDGTYKFGSL